MAEGRNGEVPAVRLEYTFDRLLGPKLEHVYAILVPEKIRVLGEEKEVIGGSHEERRNLCPRVL